MGPRNVAHRGYSGIAPENTLPAFAAAVLAGAHVVEFDVRTTRDGVPVVIHDRTVDRTTDGTGAVWELTAAEVAALDAGSWRSPAFAGAGVPTLAAVLDLLTPPGPELLLEIKPPADLAQVRVILGMVRDAGLADRTIAQSFDPAVVALLAGAAPEMRRGLLRFGFDDDQVTVAKELGLNYVNPRLDTVLTGSDVVAALAGAGVGVMPWTPNDPAQWPELVSAGVAGLISDRTGELTGWLARAAA